jgi:hypothetical protein
VPLFLKRQTRPNPRPDDVRALQCGAPAAPVDERALAQLVSMGFGRAESERALRACGNSAARATDWLLSRTGGDGAPAAAPAPRWGGGGSAAAKLEMPRGGHLLGGEGHARGKAARGQKQRAQQAAATTSRNRTADTASQSTMDTHALARGPRGRADRGRGGALGHSRRLLALTTVLLHPPLEVR